MPYAVIIRKGTRKIFAANDSLFDAAVVSGIDESLKPLFKRPLHKTFSVPVVDHKKIRLISRFKASDFTEKGSAAFRRQIKHLGESLAFGHPG